MRHFDLHMKITADSVTEHRVYELERQQNGILLVHVLYSMFLVLLPSCFIFSTTHMMICKLSGNNWPLHKA